MATNLLQTMRSCCIYKANGCRWKGLVRDLAAHHKECAYAVTQCPYGCGERVDRHTMRSHQRTCTWRLVNDCPCHTPFMLKDREAHEARCLPFLQQKLPLVTAERDAATETMRQLAAQLVEVRDGARCRFAAAGAS